MFRSIDLTYFCLCVHLYVICMQVRGQKKTLGVLELELHTTVVSCQVGAGTKPRSSGSASSTHNCWVMSPVLIFLMLLLRGSLSFHHRSRVVPSSPGLPSVSPIFILPESILPELNLSLTKAPIWSNPVSGVLIGSTDYTMASCHSLHKFLFVLELTAPHCSSR